MGSKTKPKRNSDTSKVETILETWYFSVTGSMATAKIDEEDVTQKTNMAIDTVMAVFCFVGKFSVSSEPLGPEKVMSESLLASCACKSEDVDGTSRQLSDAFGRSCCDSRSAFFSSFSSRIARVLCFLPCNSRESGLKSAAKAAALAGHVSIILCSMACALMNS